MKEFCISIEQGCNNWLPDRKSCTYGAHEMLRIHQLSVSNRKFVQLSSSKTPQQQSYQCPTKRLRKAHLLNMNSDFLLSLQTRPTLMANRAGALVTFEMLGPLFLLQYTCDLWACHGQNDCPVPRCIWVCSCICIWNGGTWFSPVIFLWSLNSFWPCPEQND